MKSRLAVLCLFALLAAACGSRDDDHASELDAFKTDGYVEPAQQPAPVDFEQLNEMDVNGKWRRKIPKATTENTESEYSIYNSETGIETNEGEPNYFEPVDTGATVY